MMGKKKCNAILLSITSVPEGSTRILLVASDVNGVSFFSHLMDGLGLPKASQGNTAIVLTGKV